MKQQQETAEQKWRDDKARATEKTAKKGYPNETWLAAEDIKLWYEELPKNLE